MQFNDNFKECKELIKSIRSRLENTNTYLSIHGSAIYGFEYTKDSSIIKPDYNSDIDLMVIGSVDGVQLHARISEIEAKIKRTINYNLMREQEFQTTKTAFLKRILGEKKIFLVGDENTLRNFA